MDIINIVNFSDCSIAHKIREKYRDFDKVYGSLDFSKIIPIPESIKISNTIDTLTPINVYLSVINPDTEDMGIEKKDKETFEQITLMIQKKRGTIPVIANINYDTILSLSSSFFEKAEESNISEFDDIFELGKVLVDNIIEHGVSTLEEWKHKYWGTVEYPFNEIEQPLSSCNVCFSTKYTIPNGVFQKLSMIYPDTKINVTSTIKSDTNTFNKNDVIVKTEFLNGNIQNINIDS